jgi:hypothetical protein
MERIYLNRKLITMDDAKKQPEKSDISKLCCCLEKAGDNPNCKVHYPEAPRAVSS